MQKDDPRATSGVPPLLPPSAPHRLPHRTATPSVWRIDSGTYRIALGRAADDLVLTEDVQLTQRLFGRCRHSLNNGCAAVAGPPVARG
jgi:hypothetical protein